MERAAADPETFVPLLVPALRRLSVSAAALARWREPHDEAGGGPERAGEVISVRVWRQGFDVYHCSMDPVEANCLAAMLEEGASLARLGEIVATAMSGPRATKRLAKLLDMWTLDALLDAAS